MFSETATKGNLQTETQDASQQERVIVPYKIDFNSLNLNDYKDLDTRVKRISGYAMMQVEPLPRFRIMKLGLIILKKLEEDVPKNAMFRVYLGNYYIE